MSERENIFAHIREALRVPAPLHGQKGGSAAAEGSRNGMPARQWLPKVGSSPEEKLELFRRNSVDLKATFHVCETQGKTQSLLRELCVAEGWKKVAAHQGILSAAACDGLPVPVQIVDHGYDPKELEKCDAGITECDALIAQTGSVLVTSRSAGGRALSVLPPHHVVLARKDQLIADLPEAFALLKQRYGQDYPSFISFTSGPSRTGDIERILVLGAHGPKKLTIICF